MKRNWTRWTISVPNDLAAEVEQRLGRTPSGRVAYGAKQALMLRLLRDWLAEQKRREEEVNV